MTLSSWAIPERNSKMFSHCANKLIVLYYFFVILEKFIYFFYIFLDSFWPHEIIKLAKWGHQRTADIGEITFSEKILIIGRIVWSNFINNLTSQLKKKKKKKKNPAKLPTQNSGQIMWSSMTTYLTWNMYHFGLLT